MEADLVLPPRPADAHRPTIELILTTLRSALAPREAIYVAGPITGGRHNGEVAGASDRGTLTAANMARGCEAVLRIRKSSTRPVVHPFSLDVPDWGQNDYVFLWGEVVREFSSTVVFLDGWEFSNGSAYEFLTAVRYQSDLKDERLVKFSPEEGLRKLAEANKQLGDIGRSSSFTAKVVLEVEAFLGSRRGHSDG